MKKRILNIKNHLKALPYKKIVKSVGVFIVVLVAVLGLVTGLFSWYFTSHKKEIVALVNAKINEKSTASVVIGDIDYKLFKGFPSMTLALSQVVVKDSMWQAHKRTLLRAEKIELRLNVVALLGNQIEMDKIEIQQAKIHLFKGKNGLDNTLLFRVKPKNKEENKKSPPSIDQIILSQVRFISEHQENHKLFDFDSISLQSKVQYDGDNWHAFADLSTHARSMAFNTQRGSFIENKKVHGLLGLDFNAESNSIAVVSKELAIGNTFFEVDARFNLDPNTSPFKIALNATLLWREASSLLSNNISEKINQFDFKKPIQVGCTINGDMSKTGDPEIIVQAKIKNNDLKLPDGLITACTFDATFINNYKKGAGFNDANSAITITDMKGKFKTIPFEIPIGIILNLEKTEAAGSFRSNFPITQLNQVINKELMHFSGGQAKVNLDFKFDVQKLRIKKPKFTGNVYVKDAIVNYGPRNLTFLKTDIQLDFTEKALLIKKINFKDNRNSVFMEGRIDNFMTLYYENPEKMIVNWDIYAPFLDVKQCIGALTSSSKKPAIQEKSQDSFSKELYEVIDKCQVVLKLKADKMTYSKLVATQTKATIVLVNNSLRVSNGSVQCAGGTVDFEGQLTPEKDHFKWQSETKIQKVNLNQFLEGLNNFGITSFEPRNVKGKLTATAKVQGLLQPGGQLKTNSMKGVAKFEVVKGALIDFKPITNIAKFAFPFRDVNNISFSDLSGDFKINGEKIQVNALKVSSNVLNLDAKGVYSYGRGTRLAMTIPLRNPKKDHLLLTDKEREEKRTKGIVLHLIAADVDGKIKIKWNKNHE
ncbi:AsmA family protein [Flavobacterium sp. FPG59]|uniref:AsmA family protein n=1 Tax=Flavobacterium sp. FPG59 TaxID=1929267 RepID=UPI000A38C4F1|nr:AsmA family protein [Flavobacterium sp. FPG59]OUD36882.1 hypothetical protein FPG59_04130 [Flavobacterium sp. FPG59]